MKYIVAEIEYRFNKEQDQSEHRACEVVQVCDSKKEADDIASTCEAVSNYSINYGVITEDQIGEWVR